MMSPEAVPNDLGGGLALSRGECQNRRPDPCWSI